jgi:sulfur-oxidizing protein SoxB
MNLSRREFLQVLAAAAAMGAPLSAATKSASGSFRPLPKDFYQIPNFGNVSLLHYTDCHAQLLPIYFREPEVNLGIGSMYGRPPHLVGQEFLEHFNIPPNGPLAHAFTYLDFAEASKHYGKVGGFAHLSTLVKRLRADRPGALLLDGGDTWQGSGTALWTNAQDMVDAQLKLGVDVMTPHWEMTYGDDRVREIINNDFAGQIDFVAQNVVDKLWGDPVFDSHVIKEINGVPVAIIGQAFPYTPIANPQYLIPDWSFGIRDRKMQDAVNKARRQGAQVVVVLSHNGMDVDLKMASQVEGIDAILGGHTHDAVPEAMKVANPAGETTLVMNSGSNGKFLSVLDLDVRNGRIQDYRYQLVPVFADHIEADPEMAKYIEDMRQSEVTYNGETFRMSDRLNEELAVTDDTLYRRGNFNGTFDQVICNALMEEMDAEVAFSPGFRWGVSVPPGHAITMEHVLTQTAITYPTVTRNEMTGERIKTVLEDVADNIFNKDPYYQQGGDMVRVGGVRFAMDPTATIGNRVSDMEINGKPVDPKKNYVVAGWANVNQRLEGIPVWEVVASHLRKQKVIRDVELNEPKLKNVTDNPGYGS